MFAEPHFPFTKKTINCRGRLLDISQGAVMGILNTTPDSFYDGGKYKAADAALSRVETMLNEGAAIIDVGGYSTRPGADVVTEEEERRRLIPLIEILIKKFPDIIISADTWRPSLAEEAILAGAVIINDISGGRWNDAITDVLLKYKVPYILMHSKGEADSLHKCADDTDVVNEVLKFFIIQTKKLNRTGVTDIILDPGFGFSKKAHQSFTLLRHLQTFLALGYPVLAGLSRKSMLYKTLDTIPENALNATTVANTLALMNGASLLRVHDVKEAVECLKLYNKYILTGE